MSKIDIDKAYVSPYDKFLFAFDANHKHSESQIKEINKHKRIAQLRDVINPHETKRDIWEKF